MQRGTPSSQDSVDARAGVPLPVARGVGRRGENRRRVLEAVEQNPSASARDIATATGIARPTVATTLAKLVRDRELAKSGGRRDGVRYHHPERSPDSARTGGAADA